MLGRIFESVLNPTYEIIDSFQHDVESRNYKEILSACNTFLTDLGVLQDNKVKMSMSKNQAVSMQEILMNAVRLRYSILKLQSNNAFAIEDIFMLQKQFIKNSSDEMEQLMNEIIDLRQLIINQNITLYPNA